MKNSTFISVIFYFMVLGGSAQALKISDFYQDAKVGSWILMKSSDGLITRTAVVAKGDGKVTLRIKNYTDDKQISDSEQVFDVEQGRVVVVRIYEGNKVREIFPEKTEMDDFFQMEFKEKGAESVWVGKGKFKCWRYKGIYNDRVVKAWINEEVPILHLVKITTQGASVQLVDYGQ